MKNMTLEYIAKACGGSYIGAEKKKSMCVSDITTDSRKVSDRCLFVAIRGSRVDGHDFIDQVVEKGALAVLSEKNLGACSFPYIIVRSTTQAVKDLAEYYLEQLHIPVIGITGSVGKTSTKEMTAAVLSQKYRVLKTQGNFNNELGLPLTVFRLRDEDEMAILEMGISDFGEMSRLARIARPKTAVITNIGYCHLENLKDRDGVFKAKTEIFDYVRDDGHIILNGDDDKLDQVQEVHGIRPVKFGLEPKNDVYADNIRSLGFTGMSCTIHTPVGSFATVIPMPGKHMVYNALAGTCAGFIYGLTLNQIKAGIESYKPLDGRFHIITTSQYRIIDDCYNANPMSMKASLEVLSDGSGRKVAILGDMAELGKDERKLHEEVGEFAGRLKLDALYCAGPLCESLAKSAKKSNPKLDVCHFRDKDVLIRRLPALLKAGDTILVKASHSMVFEQIVKYLKTKEE